MRQCTLLSACVRQVLRVCRSHDEYHSSDANCAGARLPYSSCCPVDTTVIATVALDLLRSMQEAYLNRDVTEK